jgi:hypothetical protein
MSTTSIATLLRENVTLIKTAVCSLLIFAGAGVASAQLQIDWHTIDGGGHMFSTGGGFELGGTIGQHDAGSFSAPLTGGGFELVGGFWPVAVPSCTCPGDLNADGLKNGRDIGQFVQCVISIGPACGCADVDGVPGISPNDVSVFVADLLAGSACP